MIGDFPYSNIKIPIMNTCFSLIFFIFINYCQCRDFYVGMFKKNDFLVAQDKVYKERVPYRITFTKYGRVFKCPITYFRVVDRLGVGRGPQVEIIRGGLRRKFIVLRLKSGYNLPISVNIYVGCENKQKPKTKSTMRTTTKTKAATKVTVKTSKATQAGNMRTTSEPKKIEKHGKDEDKVEDKHTTHLSSTHVKNVTTAANNGATDDIRTGATNAAAGTGTADKTGATSGGSGKGGTSNTQSNGDTDLPGVTATGGSSNAEGTAATGVITEANTNSL